MSTATLFLGIDITDLYRKEPVVEYITRYNETTGGLYQKEVITGHRYF
jgi:hypothetical protein